MATELMTTERYLELLSPIFDRFNARWRHHIEFPTFIGNLTPEGQTVVLVLRLYGQVNNGGFIQWVDNGYADTRVIDALERLGDAGKTVRGWILDLEKHGLLQRNKRYSRFEESNTLEEEEDMGLYAAYEMHDSAFYRSQGAKLIEELYGYCLREVRR